MSTINKYYISIEPNYRPNYDFLFTKDEIGYYHFDENNEKCRCAEGLKLEEIPFERIDRIDKIINGALLDQWRQEHKQEFYDDVLG